jgi:glycosyltransferase involved in cell wall biosynthesis
VRIRWCRSTLPRGFKNNAQHGISLCKGDIVFLCDQDDVWYPEKVERHVVAYADPSVKWVYNKLALVDSEGKKIGLLEDTNKDYYTRRRMKLLNYTWGSCIAAALTSYRMSVLRSAMPIGELSPGHDSWIQLAIFPAKTFFIDAILQDYRQHDGNVYGWGKIDTPEEQERKEREAITANFLYLKKLSVNHKLQIWKRTFFFLVYYAKCIRSVLQKKH